VDHEATHIKQTGSISGHLIGAGIGFAKCSRMLHTMIQLVKPTACGASHYLKSDSISKHNTGLHLIDRVMFAKFATCS